MAIMPELPLNLPAIYEQARILGFADVCVAHFDSLPDAKEKLNNWLSQSMHGGMDYMQRNAHLRANPSELLPSAQSALLVRLNYLHAPKQQIALSQNQAIEPLNAQVSFYAQGRDYHTVMRKRLKKLVTWLHAQAPDASFRVFTDSAPVMEVELAQHSGLGWRGKHTLLLNREGGSLFFLGGILTTLDLPASAAAPTSEGNCGQCTACLDVCPTRAIVAPYVVDARRCISYLTIEHNGAIASELRPLMGNRIYGCDDCQTSCPWNKFATPAISQDFDPRNALDTAQLLDLWAWTEGDFLHRLEGSAIRRIGHARWLRNIATALGNALRADIGAETAVLIRTALSQHAQHPDAAVSEHVDWALRQSEPGDH